MEIQLLLHGKTGWKVDPDYGSVYGRKGPIGFKNRYGYLVAKVAPNNSSTGRKNHFLHRVVWEAVHGPIDNSKEDRFINHINGNKRDNRLVNLELVTQTENLRHARRTGLIRFRKTHGPKKAPRGAQYRAVKAESVCGTDIRHYPSISSAAREGGFSKPSVWCCCVGRMIQHRGFFFSYFDWPPTKAMEDAVKNRRIKEPNTCKRGHHFTPENTIWTGPNRRSRACRACEKLRRTTPEYREKCNTRNAMKRMTNLALRQEKPDALP